jgi:hypothetical protein
MEVEIWKDIHDYEGLYQISNFGRIKTLERTVKFGNRKRRVKSIIRKPKLKENGYLQAVLYKEHAGHDFYVHRLVATMFCSGYLKNKDVNHKDGNKRNNNADNLEWCSRSENQLHAYRQLKRGCYSKGRFGKLSHRAKPVMQLSLNGDFIKYWDCAADAQRQLGIGESSIRSCLYGRYRQAGGYVWKYHYRVEVKELKKEKRS